MAKEWDFHDADKMVASIQKRIKKMARNSLRTVAQNMADAAIDTQRIDTGRLTNNWNASEFGVVRYDKRARGTKQTGKDRVKEQLKKIPDKAQQIFLTNATPYQRQDIPRVRAAATASYAKSIQQIKQNFGLELKKVGL